MNRFEFFDRIPAMTQRQRQRIHWAYAIAKQWHKAQSRDSGERYFEHLRDVATILIDNGFKEADYIILAILHDSLEDTYISLSMLEQLFGPEVAREILTVSREYGVEDPLTGMVVKAVHRTKKEYFDSIKRCGRRAAIAKCADRIHNLSDLIDPPPESRWTPEKCMEKVSETREWILPLAISYEPRFAAKLEHLCDLIEAKAGRINTSPNNFQQESPQS
jgi:GTP diphosphokinase / guanosine-3',5'-bis(diphosphate) 3'-diphosphatase